MQGLPTQSKQINGATHYACTSIRTKCTGINVGSYSAHTICTTSWIALQARCVTNFQFCHEIAAFLSWCTARAYTIQLDIIHCQPFPLRWSAPSRWMAEKAGPFCPAGGELLVCGATDYHAIGRTKDVRSDVYPNLQMPHRFKSMKVRQCIGSGLRWCRDTRPVLTFHSCDA